MPVSDDNPVRWHRLAAGLTQIELARLAGVTRATIAQIEEGRVRSVNDAVLAILAERTGMSVAVLEAEFTAWREGPPTGFSGRALKALALAPEVVESYTSFQQWRGDIAASMTAFASLLRVPRSTVAKYEREGGPMPSSLYYALVNRLGLSEAYAHAVRGLSRKVR